jgi:CBS domain-containing protein
LFGTGVQHVAPGLHIAPGGFALVAMAATFGASIGATFASIVFLFELTRDYQIILPLMLASVVAQAVAGALLRDNLMTEKLTRRNVRVESDYAVDVLASASVRDVMTTDTQTLPRDATVGDARRRLEHDGHGAYPIVDGDGRCLAIVAREDVLDIPDGDDEKPALDVASADVVTVTPDQSLVVALRLLLDEGIGHLPVLDGGRLVGMCTRTDILRARQRRFDEDTLQPGFLRAHAAAVQAGASPAIPSVGRPARRQPAPSVLPSGRVVHHYLVVANQTLGGQSLNDAIAERVALGPSRFHVLVPATPAHDLYRNVMHALEGELPDPVAATADAQRRLDATLESIRASGATADGEIGDPDPLGAIEAVLERHHFDEIIVSTLPRAVSRWLKLDLPARVGHAFDLPVTHVVGEGRG